MFLVNIVDRCLALGAIMEWFWRKRFRFVVSSASICFSLESPKKSKSRHH